MGIFSKKNMLYKNYEVLSELTIGGEKVDNEEEFGIEDSDADESGTDTTEETETTTTETEDTGNEEEPTGEEEPDDEFSLQDDEPEEGSEETTTTEEPEAESSEDAEIKQDEDLLYDALSEDQKKIRILQLKLGFKDLYTETDAVLTAINNIPKQDDNIETIRRLIIVLNNVKQYILDYISTQFDNRSYLDNNQIYIKYINVFRTIRKVIEELNHDK